MKIIRRECNWIVQCEILTIELLRLMMVTV